MTFAEGSLVEYKGMYGYVAFICDACLTICVREFPDDPVRNVKIVVGRSDFKLISPIVGNHQRQEDYYERI
jgi:hypothetical protein